MSTPLWVEKIDEITNDICDDLNEKLYPSLGMCLGLQIVFADMVTKKIIKLLLSKDFQKKFSKGDNYEQ